MHTTHLFTVCNHRCYQLQPLSPAPTRNLNHWLPQREVPERPPCQSPAVNPTSQKCQPLCIQLQKPHQKPSKNPQGEATFKSPKVSLWSGNYPTTMSFPTKNDHFGVFGGYHHLRKHPCVLLFEPQALCKVIDLSNQHRVVAAELCYALLRTTQALEVTHIVLLDVKLFMKSWALDPEKDQWFWILYVMCKIIV